MRLQVFFLALAFFATPVLTAEAQTAKTPQRIVALGDSLTAGYGLQGGEDFASRLQATLISDGLNVKVDNAGVSGDTTAGGKARLEWAVAGDPKPKLVIVALGGNDLLRAIDPAVTKENLRAILKDLQSRNIPALLVGMRSPTNMGPAYRSHFDKIYKDLAKEFDVPLYPFFLEGVAMRADLNLPDGIHPNTKGIDVMVKGILPTVKKALKS